MNKERTLIVALFLLLSLGTTKAQQQINKRPAALVEEFKSKGTPFKNYSLLSTAPAHLVNADRVLRHYDHVQLNEGSLHDLINHRDVTLEFSFPFQNEMLNVELVEVNLFTTDFKVITNQSRGEAVDYTPGIYYRGILRDDDHSIVAFSFFNGDFSGIVSSAKYGNLVIGKMTGTTALSNDYIVYSDRDFLSPHTTQCSTIENPDYAAQLMQNVLNGSMLRTNNCVRLYYEVDHDIFLQSGSDLTATVNWMTAVHNNVGALYGNDAISTSVSSILVWTSEDPYTGQSASDQLSIFKAQRPQFSGDLAQLVSIEPNGLGGVASNINGFCSNNDKYAYSEVDYDYQQVPTYSWTVDVIAHEFGHLMGSFHTHNCSWLGGAIDDCGPLAGYPNEGSCALGPDPIGGGTIMSYCHLTNFGINFSNGFGQLPAAAMRGAINQSLCLTTDCAPIVPDYCASKGKTNSEWIQWVKFGSYENNSGAGGGYSDFTNDVINLPAGNTINFTLSPGYSGTHWVEYFSVWVDFNNDKDFFDASENVFKSSGTNLPVLQSFVVPANAIGSTRMRISMMFDTLPSSCGDFNYGEVEDYTVNLSPQVNYCASSGADASQEWIDFVQLGTLIRHSGSDGGYFDGTAMPTNVTIGTDNFITYSAGMSGNDHEEYWKLWIDYNHNGDFSDDGEKVFGRKSSSRKKLERKFNIPNTAMLGATRMRLSMARNSSPKSCEDFDYGEVEDYTINIVSQLPSLTHEQPQTISVSLYPNPANDYLMIDLSTSASTEIGIFNVQGQLLQTVSFKRDDMKKLNVASLVPGSYFIRISTFDQGYVVKKFFKS